MRRGCLGCGAGAMMGGAFDVDGEVTSDEALTVLVCGYFSSGSDGTRTRDLRRDRPAF